MKAKDSDAHDREFHVRMNEGQRADGVGEKGGGEEGAPRFDQHNAKRARRHWARPTAP